MSMPEQCLVCGKSVKVAVCVLVSMDVCMCVCIVDKMQIKHFFLNSTFSSVIIMPAYTSWHMKAPYTDTHTLKHLRVVLPYASLNEVQYSVFIARFLLISNVLQQKISGMLVTRLANWPLCCCCCVGKLCQANVESVAAADKISLRPYVRHSLQVTGKQ